LRAVYRHLSGQALTFDADGNLTSDGLRNYTWDAENRLVGITYPGQAGKATAFSYDGLGRRTAIASTPTGGGGTVTTSYIWCGSRICQARNASNAITREYFTEGEYVPGSPGQPYYYGPDQIGSVRHVFASTSSAPAYSYDPYGNALQGTAPLTDFNYAGMFYNADSGLYLTQYRIYDPVSGRWLSRDPIGERADQLVGSQIPAFLTDTITASATDPFGDVQSRFLSAINSSTGVSQINANDYALLTTLKSASAFSFLLRLPANSTIDVGTVTANLYTYVDGNPIVYIDPNGEDWKKWAKVLTIVITCKRLPEPPNVTPRPPTPISQDVNER
jgi:RHS repeat-associated protein